RPTSSRGSGRSKRSSSRAKTTTNSPTPTKPAAGAKRGPPTGGETGLNFYAAGTNVGEHGLDALLVDDPNALAAHAESHPAVLAGHPVALPTKVGQAPLLGPDVRVRHVHAHERALSGDLADLGHG